ncbi:MAG: LPP20 family lipoprotein [Gallionella sp.]|nr:LPP20 family lipoprotein [Gallionella sp.]
MRKIFCVLLSVTMVLSVDALGGTPTTTGKVIKAKKCLFPKSRKRAPLWVCNAPVDGLAVTAVGSAAKSGAGISFMEQMAAADARVRLARNLREALNLRGSVQKNLSGQQKIAGSANSANKDTADRDSALITRITDESLQGTKVMKSAYGPDGTLYVLVGLDAASAQNLHESITTDYPEQKRK